MVTVSCTSTPAGAVIFNEAGQQIGATPMSLRLSRDTKHKLTFRLSGYQDVDRPLDLSAFAGDTMPVDVALPTIARTPPSNKKPPKSGNGGNDISVFE
jgi:serine/threonine-protein kinase